MSKDSIALIGFMATGKTTIGKALVVYLGNEYRFIETDQLIIQKVGKSISKIFAEEGEDKFREIENEICEKVSKLNKVVISCGGGVVLNIKNVETLKQNCHIVLLTASQKEIYKRIIKNGIPSRPVINKKNTKREIKEILKFRKNFYKEAAEIIIDTSKKKYSEYCERDCYKNSSKNLNLNLSILLNI